MKPTEKQVKLLKKLGIDVDKDMTKSEAAMLIEEELEMRAAYEDAEYDHHHYLNTDDIPAFDRRDYYDPYSDY